MTENPIPASVSLDDQGRLIVTLPAESIPDLQAMGVMPPAGATPLGIGPLFPPDFPFEKIGEMLREAFKLPRMPE